MNEIIISRRVPQRWELLWKGACQIGRHSGLLLLLCAFVLKYCFHPSATRFQSVGMSVRPAEQQPMCRPPFIPTGDQCRVFLYSPFSAHFLYSRLSILPTKMPLFLTYSVRALPDFLSDESEVAPITSDHCLVYIYRDLFDVNKVKILEKRWMLKITFQTIDIL